MQALTIHLTLSFTNPIGIGKCGSAGLIRVADVSWRLLTKEATTFLVVSSRHKEGVTQQLGPRSSTSFLAQCLGNILSLYGRATPRETFSSYRVACYWVTTSVYAEARLGCSNLFRQVGLAFSQIFMSR